MTPMCDIDGVMVGWAIGVADCAGTVELEYFDYDGGSEGGSLPAGWKPCVQGERGPAYAASIDTLTYSSTTNIDFAGADFQLVTLTGDVIFSGSNYSSPKEITVIVSADAGTRELTFPGAWVFASDKPVDIASNTTGVLHLISTTTSASGVIATWTVPS